MITPSFLPFPLFRGSQGLQLSEALSRYAPGATVHYIQFGFYSEPKPDHVRRVELWCRKHCLVSRWAYDRGQTEGLPRLLIVEFREGLLNLFRQEIGGPETLRQFPRFFLRTTVVSVSASESASRIPVRETFLPYAVAWSPSDSV